MVVMTKLQNILNNDMMMVIGFSAITEKSRMNLSKDKGKKSYDHR